MGRQGLEGPSRAPIEILGLILNLVAAPATRPLGPHQGGEELGDQRSTALSIQVERADRTPRSGVRARVLSLSRGISYRSGLLFVQSIPDRQG